MAFDVERFFDGDDIPQLEEGITSEEKEVAGGCIDLSYTDCQGRAFGVVRDEEAVDVFGGMGTGNDTRGHQAAVEWIKMSADFGFYVEIFNKNGGSRWTASVSLE
jgi:hypothetical protein